MYIVNKNVGPDGFTRAAVLAGSTATDADVIGSWVVAQKNDNFELNFFFNQLSDITMLRSTSIESRDSQLKLHSKVLLVFRSLIPNSSLTTQYCHGLRSAMVVTDFKDPHASLYDTDNEDTVITLADWYHTVTPSTGAIPTSDATLINGRGRYAGRPTVPLSVINVEAWKKYRFRLVSVVCDPNYVFSIDSHTMTVVEVDSVNHGSYEVDSIRIFSGQRYSFVLNANQPVDNYWIWANPNVGTPGFINGINSAILCYKDAPAADPTSTQPPNSNPLVESSLVPHSIAGLGAGSGTPGVAINLAVAFDVSQFRFTTNGAYFHLPNSEPILLQTISAGSASGPYPIPLHGHAFEVVRSAGSSIYNYVNPPRRDVVSLGTPGDNVTTRFRTDNPGPWIMHCGLSVVFAEDTATININDPPGKRLTHNLIYPDFN
ncbi:Laccase-2 [Leucoagaricus sp. SymC.cos]|nr:Laccase-2 [Leucoagaricus sp. SymC.cos]